MKPALSALSPAAQTRIAEAAEAIDPQIWLITAAADGQTGGLVATFVTKASIVPDCPRFVIGLAKQHHTWQLIEKSGCCALHLIARDQHNWVMQLGGISGRNSSASKLTGFSLGTLCTGAPILQEAIAAFDCRVEARLDSGDRTIYLLAVADAHSQPGHHSPLRYSELWSELSPKQRQELSELFQKDQPIDRAAIQQWRAEQEKLQGNP